MKPFYKYLMQCKLFLIFTYIQYTTTLLGKEPDIVVKRLYLLNIHTQVLETLHVMRPLVLTYKSMVTP